MPGCQYTGYLPCVAEASAVLWFKSETGLEWAERLCQSHEEPRAREVKTAHGTLERVEMIAGAQTAV